jgi:glycosyltransferase involved in cell wall biosynthesis
MLNNSFVLVTCVYNSEKWIDRCIESCNIQGDDVGHIIVDDCSTDSTYEKIKKHKRKDRLILRTRKRLRTPGYTQQKVIKSHVGNPESIIGVIDGDDYLFDDAVEVVRKNIGDNWMFCSNRMNGKIEQDRYKIRCSTPVNWDIPIRDQPFMWHHFRGFKKHLSDRVNPKDFFNKNNRLMGAGSDIPYMYAMLEMAGEERSIYIYDTLYYHNIYNPLNDHKVYYLEQYNAKFHVKDIDAYDKI